MFGYFVFLSNLSCLIFQYKEDRFEEMLKKKKETADDLGWVLVDVSKCVFETRKLAHRTARKKWDISISDKNRYIIGMSSAHWQLLAASADIEWKGLNNIHDKHGRFMGSFMRSPCGEEVQLWDAPEWFAHRARYMFEGAVRVDRIEH
jgi:hypothetical protein